MRSAAVRFFAVLLVLALLERVGAESAFDPEGAVHLPPLTVPYSSFASPQSKVAYLATREFFLKELSTATE